MIIKMPYGKVEINSKEDALEGNEMMFKWLKKKIKDYQNKRRIKKLPVWFRKRLSLENYDLSDKCILSYDFSEQKKRNN